MSAVLAVDGGQSGIRLRHSGSAASVEVEGVSRLEGDIVASVAGAVGEGWRALGSPPVELAVLGLTTAPVVREEAERLSGLVSSAVGAGRVLLADDTVTVHAGALSGGWGVALAVGTGVACLGISPDGASTATIDGHGYLLGDDGGGYWIGREGLRAVLRAADGRGRATAITDAAIERFGPIDGLHVRIHGMRRLVNAIAQFAPAVLACAADDRIASGILDRAAVSLAQSVDAAALRTSRGTGAIPVALGGRLLEPGSPLRVRLDAALIAGELKLAVRDADGSALDGALRLASGLGRHASLIHLWKASMTR